MTASPQPVGSLPGTGRSLLPNFLGIGAQRAATTWIHNCLAEHPDVCVPHQKELAFFDFRFEKGVDWYAAHFAAAGEQKAIGEITPTYFSNRAALERIAEHLPAVRLFVILRNPVDRAFSAYQLFRSQYDWTSFPHAYESSPYLINLGMYARHLQVVYELFDRERVKVLFYDDIQQDPQAVLFDLFRFLGIDETFTPQAQTERYNRIVLPGMQDRLRRLGLGWGVELVKRTPLARLIKEFARPAGPTRRDLRHLRSVYRDDVLQLQELTGRDLSHWIGEVGANT